MGRKYPFINQSYDFGWIFDGVYGSLRAQQAQPIGDFPVENQFVYGECLQ
jgi:hypothetical protein